MAVAGLPALLLLLSGDRAAALLTSDAAVIAACSSLMRPLALLMLSEWSGGRGPGQPWAASTPPLTRCPSPPPLFFTQQ